jgi:hypothetical protein
MSPTYILIYSPIGFRKLGSVDFAVGQSGSRKEVQERRKLLQFYYIARFCGRRTDSKLRRKPLSDNG